MKILAFAASSSSKSINKQLVTHAANVVKADISENSEVEILDINDYEMPIFSSDREDAGGIPDLAHAFKAKIEGADVVMISFAEHNGSYSAAYKNLFDWTSRIDAKVYKDKKMVLLATSPGGGGAASVLASAVGSIPHFGGTVVGQLSVPAFYDVFDTDAGRLADAGVAAELEAILQGLA